MSKCRLIPESFSANVPVAAQSFAPKKGIVVSVAHMLINTVRRNSRNSLERSGDREGEDRAYG